MAPSLSTRIVCLEILRQRYACGEIETVARERMRERIIASREREQPPSVEQEA